MLIVRNYFVAKPGCASKLASQLKDSMTAFQLPNARILTDVTGDFNRVIMEYTAANMAEIETRMHEVMSIQSYRDKMAGYTELWITGGREILRVV